MEDSPDDTLEHISVMWFQRLRQGEIPPEEARAILRTMNAQLEFLRNLYSRIESHPNASKVQPEIER